MSSKIVKVLLGAVTGFLVAGVIFSSGLTVGLALPQLDGRQGLLASPDQIAVATQAPNQDVAALFAPFWQAWDIVHREYVDQPVDDALLMQGAIRGMIDGLGDAQSSYMNPDEYRQASMPMEGSYEGIGAWVDSEAEYLTIISPMPGSPAEQAGLQPGDQIIAVDGEDMTGIDPSLVVRRVMGPAGSTVHLTIHREGQADPLEVDLVRARIVVPSIESELRDDGIAYVQLLTFGGETTDDLRRALRGLVAQSPRGLILDLRGNGGGLLSTALEVASEFIPEGTIMIERYGDGTEETYTADPGGLATDIPLVVLINGGSASASEIVAGAIQDRGRGLLVGETSFGKGSVQNWIALGSDGAVRVTIARWLTPNGRQIDHMGLTPDVEVTMTQADTEAGRDPQLDRAVELLLESAGQSSQPGERG